MYHETKVQTKHADQFDIPRELSYFDILGIEKKRERS